MQALMYYEKLLDETSTESRPDGWLLYEFSKCCYSP